MTFDPHFRFYTVAPEHGHLLDASSDQRAEMLAVIEHARTYWPAKVAKGLMKRDELDKALRVFAALHLDWDRAEHRPDGPNATWSEQIHALRREIARRRASWPQLVLTNRMTADDAARRLALIEGIHDLWWQCGKFFQDGRAAHADTEHRRQMKDAA